MNDDSDAGGPALVRRLLPARGPIPALEICSTDPEGSGAKPPILCLHGAFGGAWMWSERALPALGALGRRATALSLRGHGGSQGRELLRRATIGDYLADVMRVMDELGEPPILVAHSFGALLAQRLLGRRPMRALVLLAPLPPEGMLLHTPRLLLTAPQVWLEVFEAVFGDRVSALRHVKDTVFSDRFSPAEVERYLALMVTEGQAALLEGHVPLPVVPALVLGVPTLVVGGGRDLLVSDEAVLRTALYHAADRRVVAGAGHLFQLEPDAAAIMADLVGWLEARGL